MTLFLLAAGSLVIGAALSHQRVCASLVMTRPGGSLVAGAAHAARPSLFLHEELLRILMKLS